MDQWNPNDQNDQNDPNVDGSHDDSTIAPLDQIKHWATQQGFEVWTEINGEAERIMVRRLFKGLRWTSIFDVVDEGARLRAKVDLSVILWEYSFVQVKDFLIRLARVVTPGIFAPDDTGTTILYIGTLDLTYAPLTQRRWNEFFTIALATAYTFLRDLDELTTSTPAKSPPSVNGHCPARKPGRRHRSPRRRGWKRSGWLPSTYSDPLDCDLGDWFL